jgi:hypothetical protein
MAGAKWEFWLANSNNLSRIAPLTRARQKQVSLVLNMPGNASFALPMTDEHAPLIEPFSTCVLAFRTGSTGTKLIWSGYVATIDEDITGNSMVVNAVGWLERLFKRMLRLQKVYADTDDGSIIFDLLSLMNLTFYGGYVVPVVFGSSPNNPTWIQEGAKLPNEGLGGATAYVNALRNKTFEAYTVVGPEIQALNQLENGCDLELTPDTRTLNLYRKRMRDRPEAQFGYNWGPNNIGQLGRQIDGTTLVNYLLAIGRPEVVPQFADDAASQALFGLIEESVSLTDARDASILSYYAGAEVALRAQPRVIYSMTPLPWLEGKGIPEPFVDYDLGDKAYFSARWGERIDIQKQAVRVFGISMQIDEEGNERPGPLQLSPNT